MADAAERKEEENEEEEGRKKEGRLARKEREKERIFRCPFSMDRRKKEFLVWTSPTGRAGGS